jgi:hypothetical protein
MGSEECVGDGVLEIWLAIRILKHSPVEVGDDQTARLFVPKPHQCFLLKRIPAKHLLTIASVVEHTIHLDHKGFLQPLSIELRQNDILFNAMLVAVKGRLGPFDHPDGREYLLLEL